MRGPSGPWAVLLPPWDRQQEILSFSSLTSSLPILTVSAVFLQHLFPSPVPLMALHTPTHRLHSPPFYQKGHAGSLLHCPVPSLPSLTGSPPVLGPDDPLSGAQAGGSLGCPDMLCRDIWILLFVCLLFSYRCAISCKSKGRSKVMVTSVIHF